jgi:hypothetical protein
MGANASRSTFSGICNGHEVGGVVSSDLLMRRVNLVLEMLGEEKMKDEVRWLDFDDGDSRGE